MDTQQLILNGLISRGVPEHVAQGFVMNFADESSLNPDLNEVAPIVPGSRGGYGLAQWTGPRRTALESYAQSRGVPVSDIDLQLDYLLTELKGPEKAAYDAILATTTPQDAAVAILNNFERPAEVHRRRREAKYLGGDVPGVKTPGNALTPALGPSGGDQNALAGLMGDERFMMANALGLFDEKPPLQYGFQMTGPGQ